MISREDNNLLTQTGPGTPCGELMRRYWQPIALSEELPQGGAPLRVNVLGEELVLFRDDQARLGLLGLHCSHRGTDLSYGRIENGGLRCIYHGWVYDVCGRVIEQPGEPGGGANRDQIRHRAHPCRETGGVILTYMGPGEPPLLPDYEFLAVPEEQRTVTKILYSCNYLQGNEGNIDPVHLSFLHQFLGDAPAPLRRVVPGTETTDNTLLRKDIAPTIEVELTDFGLRICSLRASGEDKTYLRVTNFVMQPRRLWRRQRAGDRARAQGVEHSSSSRDDHSERRASQRLVALSAKALDATVLAQPELGEAMRTGMNVLAHMRDMQTAAFPMNAIVVRRSFLAKNREVVKRFQQAYAEATYQLLNDKQKAIAVLTKRLQQKNPKAVEETYDYIATSFSFPTRIAQQGVRNTLEMVAQRNPAAKVDMNMTSMSMRAPSMNWKKKGSSGNWQGNDCSTVQMFKSSKPEKHGSEVKRTKVNLSLSDVELLNY